MREVGPPPSGGGPALHLEARASRTSDATGIHAIHANMPKKATVATDAIPAATPSQPSQAGSPPRIVPSDAGTAMMAKATPLAPRTNQPETHRLLGDLDSAVAAAREAASIAEDAGNREHHAYALAHMARYDLLRHDPERAAEDIVASLRAASDGGGLWVTAIAFLYASEVALSFDRDAERRFSLARRTQHSTPSARNAGPWSATNGSPRSRSSEFDSASVSTSSSSRPRA
jgi:hypothetical protein